MFWENQYDPTIVGCDLSDEELQQFLKENDILFEIVDNSTRWGAYAQWYAYQQGFDMIKATSFAYMVSMFMSGMGVSAGTEMYFKEEKIEFCILDKWNELKREIDSEEEQVKILFNFIFEVYSKNISDYEYSTKRLSFKLTPSEMDKFQAIEGETNKDKFKYLLGLSNEK